MLPKLREMNLSDCNAFKEEDGKNREELPLLQPKLTWNKFMSNFARNNF